MDDIEALLSQMRVIGVNRLLVAAAFCRRIGLIQTVDRLVPTGMDVGVGTVVQGMVLDTLSGRSPLYRLQEFFEQQDSRLLLGAEVPASAFNDTTVARALAAVCDAGAGKVFSGVAYQAARQFPQDLRTLHWDSTSVNVWGDYAGAGTGGDGLAIERQIVQEADALAALCRRQSRREYFCRADADAEAQRLRSQRGQFHRLETAVVEKLRHPPGRPPRDRPRPVASVRYLVQARPEPDALPIARQREEAGCFVLLSNVPEQGPHARTGPDLLRAYKDQHAIERNFSFLKDPLIVNDLFLKKPGRIEALGAILLISLLVWNLIEQCLRQHVEQTGAALPGWDRKDTLRPTTFMMTTKFAGLQIVRIGERYRLARPLRDVQAAYLRALDLSLNDLLPAPTGPP
jgi:hypothetical protein